MIRNIIHIDYDLCEACGRCVEVCPNQALQLVGNKPALVDPVLCDGSGKCVSQCPNGAATVQLTDAKPFDAEILKLRQRLLSIFPLSLFVSEK